MFHSFTKPSPMDRITRIPSFRASTFRPNGFPPRLSSTTSKVDTDSEFCARRPSGNSDVGGRSTFSRGIAGGGTAGGTVGDSGGCGAGGVMEPSEPGGSGMRISEVGAALGGRAAACCAFCWKCIGGGCGQISSCDVCTKDGSGCSGRESPSLPRDFGAQHPDPPHCSSSARSRVHEVAPMLLRRQRHALQMRYHSITCKA
mmetsp:Transcript_46189/g.122443  ORF Transcript_46189/g.122443 Transcript_46189/m.122443 type:complete len:201 (+) Transcript_46189:269-871(+)